MVAVVRKDRANTLAAMFPLMDLDLLWCVLKRILSTETGVEEGFSFIEKFIQSSSTFGQKRKHAYIYVGW